MTCVLEIEAKEPVGAGGSAPAWDLAGLCLLPFALMLMLFRAYFGRKLDWLKEQRRTRPHPANWREHYESLRRAEWSVIEVTAAGLAQLLAGKDLNLQGIVPVDPPEDWHCPMPPSAHEMHRRLEALIAFNADPEGRIRRLAGRIARAMAALAAEDIALEVLPMRSRGRQLARPCVHGGGGPSALIRAPPIGTHGRNGRLFFVEPFDGPPDITRLAGAASGMRARASPRSS